MSLSVAMSCFYKLK